MERLTGRKVLWINFYEPFSKIDGKISAPTEHEAVFLSFGVSFIELNLGVGIFSTALIEFEDGEIKNVPVQEVKFIKHDTSDIPD